MRRREPFQFVAFDVLALNGKDVRAYGSQALAPDHRAEALEVDPLRTARRRSRPGAVRSGLQPGPRGNRREEEALGLRPFVAARALGEDQEPGMQPGARSSLALRAGVTTGGTVVETPPA
jgi:hypothetical protein